MRGRIEKEKETKEWCFAVLRGLFFCNVRQDGHFLGVGVGED